MSVVFAFFKHKPRATFFIVGLNLTIAALMCNLFLTVGQGVVKKIYIVTLLRDPQGDQHTISVVLVRMIRYAR